MRPVHRGRQQRRWKQPRGTKLVFCAMLTLLCGIATPSQALQITPLFVDAAGESWTQERQDVVWQGIADWTSLILDDQSFDITFTFAAEGSEGYLGLWQASYSYFDGDNVLPWYDGVEHTVLFNVDLFSGDNYIWWGLDAQEQPFEAWDALTVVRHEIGHALGYTGLYGNNYGVTGEEYRYYDLWVSGSTFDAGGLNIALASEGDTYHVSMDYENLMSPALVNGVRRDIEPMNLDMLELAYGYSIIPEPGLFGLLVIGWVGILAVHGRKHSAP